MVRLRTWPLLYPLLLLAIFLVGAVLRLVYLDSKTLWYDEAVLFWISRGNIAQILAQNATHNSAPPLFALALSAMTHFGTSETVLRLLPWASGSFSVPAMYLLARKFVSRPASLIAALLIAIAPVQIEYSQQVREYSLSVLLAIIMLYTFMRFLEDPSWKRVTALTTTIVLGLFTQYGLALLNLALNGVFIAHLLIVDRGRRSHAIRWLIVQSVAFVFVVAVVVLALGRQFQPGGFAAQGHLASGYWGQGTLVSAGSFVYSHARELIDYALPGPLFALVVYTGVTVIGFERMRSVTPWLIVIPFVITAAAGLARLYPFLAWRQDLFLTPLLYLVAAIAFDYAMRVDSKNILALVILLLLMRKAATPISNYYRSPGSSSEGRLVAQLETLTSPNEPIYVCDSSDPVLRYYLDIRYPSISNPIVARVRDQGPRDYLAQADTLVKQNARAWFLLGPSCGDTEPFLMHLKNRWHITKISEGYPSTLYVATR